MHEVAHVSSALLPPKQINGDGSLKLITRTVMGEGKISKTGEKEPSGKSFRKLNK